MRNLFSLAVVLLISGSSTLFAQPLPNRKLQQEDKFRQLEEILPTPNGYRTASGEPGPQYWQQSADYVIDIQLNDKDQSITARETITYKNNSPHVLKYLWLQLDANIFKPDSDASLTRQPMAIERMSVDMLRGMVTKNKFDGGLNITEVTDSAGQALGHSIVKTMMRVELPRLLQPSEEFSFNIGWNYKINNARTMQGRTGYEYFEKDGNYIYEIAQWFPRLAAYTDATGWQHKQYLGQGEFTLEFGDYLVRITAPSDHIVGATGVLQNPSEVLSAEQRQRLEEAKTATQPVFIVTPEEAKANETEKSSDTKTWVFHAKKVRDFAFASSRKFIWDAMGHNVDGNPVMAMSLYPNEGEPLWSKYSTHAIIHTLNVYSRYTFAYPYPVAYSVNGPVGGMEYPMICFNGPRPLPDGTYSAATKYALLTVIIHEVGHNYFPMIVNSDERQWTWMDEGINTFLQYLSEQEWEEGYPSQRGEPNDITTYMQSSEQVPIMTNSESVVQFGDNAYGKPATALNILRETIMGRDLFDYSFREYANRWKFKRPLPADFFRTMEDASGIDLDWFWRGWFYTTDHVDIAIDGIDLYVPDLGDPVAAAELAKETSEKQRPSLSKQRNKELEKRVDLYPGLKDFYNEYDPNEVSPEAKRAFERSMSNLTDEDKEFMAKQNRFYRVRFKNLGGLVMPVILHVTYEDGSEQVIRLPAEIWKQNSEKCATQIITDKPIKQFELDPYRETADANRNNNFFPAQLEPTRFQTFKGRAGFRPGGPGDAGGGNPMQQNRRSTEARAKVRAESEKAKADEEKAKEEKAKDEAKKAELEKKEAEAKKEAEKNAAEKKEDKD